jgi:hypothetical protein
VAAKHVFLSYCRENVEDVRKLRDDLIAADVPTWWDQDILPGQDWKLAIRTAMHESYAVVLCLSQETDARNRAGIYPEALDAIEYYREHKPGGIFLIPVRLSECEIPPIQIDPLRMLDRLQRADLFPPSRRGDGLQRLIQALRAAHPRPDGTGVAPRGQRPYISRRPQEGHSEDCHPRSLRRHR